MFLLSSKAEYAYVVGAVDVVCQRLTPTSPGT